MASTKQSALGWGWRLLGRLGTDVRPQEARLTAALFGYSFLLGAFQIAAKSIRQSSFVDSLGYERLPYVYLVVALCAYPLVRGYTRIAARVPLDQLVPRSTLAVIAGLVLFWWLFGYTSAEIRFVFYVWISITTLLAFSQFWTWTAEVLDSRQARRLFAFVLSGQLIGGVAGGQIARLVAIGFDSRATLLAGALLLAGTLVVVPVVLAERPPRSSGPRPSATSEGTVADPTGAFTEIRRSPHLRAITGLMLISIMVAQITDLQFNWVVEQSTELLDQRTGVYGNFFSIVGLVAFFLQLLATSRIHRVLGVGFALRVLPTSLAMGSVALLTTAAFMPGALLWAVAAVKLGEGSLRYSLDQGTRELLFVPVPEEIRPRVKAFIDVFVQRFARALAAILLLTVTFAWVTPVQASWYVLGLVTIWWGLTVIARRHYVATFREGLLARRIDPEERLDPSDITTLEVLVRSLGSPDPREVLHSMELLLSQGRGLLIPPLLLHHDDADVRRRTLEVLRQLERYESRELVERLVGDHDADVRVEAVRTLAALSRTGAADLMVPKLRDPDPRVRAAAIICLAQLEDQSDERADHALDLMLQDENPAVRSEAALALGNLEGAHIQTRLIQMLSDSDLTVVRAAVSSVQRRTASEGVNFLYVPILISLLRERRLKHEVRDALVDCGEIVIPALAHFMDDPREFHWVRRALPKTISRFGGEEAKRTLLNSLASDDVLLRAKIIEALASLRDREPRFQLDGDEIHGQIRREARLFLRASTRLSTLSRPEDVEIAGIRVIWLSEPGPCLLQQLLIDRMNDHAHNLFGLLSLILSHRDTWMAYEQLKSRDRRRRSHAVEYLDNALSTDLRRHVLAIIDDVPVAEREAEAERLYYISPGSRQEILRRLVDGAADDDPVGLWLGAAALSYIDEEALKPLFPVVEKIANRSSSPLLKETARWIVGRWSPPSPSVAPTTA
jgi:AAA family ATP:ADP antiporter